MTFTQARGTRLSYFVVRICDYEGHAVGNNVPGAEKWQVGFDGIPKGDESGNDAPQSHRAGTHSWVESALEGHRADILSTHAGLGLAGPGIALPPTLALCLCYVCSTAGVSRVGKGGEEMICIGSRPKTQGRETRRKTHEVGERSSARVGLGR